MGYLPWVSMVVYGSYTTTYSEEKLALAQLIVSHFSRALLCTYLPEKSIYYVPPRWFSSSTKVFVQVFDCPVKASAFSICFINFVNGLFGWKNRTIVSANAWALPPSVLLKKFKNPKFGEGFMVLTGQHCVFPLGRHGQSMNVSHTNIF